MRPVPPAIASMNDLSDAFLAGSRDLYLPRLRKIDRSGIRVEKDAAYGPDPRHRLDIHSAGPRAPAPVVLFFHGGGYTRGHKNEEGELLYGNVADFFARHGLVGINATYRLAP